MSFDYILHIPSMFEDDDQRSITISSVIHRKLDYELIRKPYLIDMKIDVHVKNK